MSALILKPEDFTINQSSGQNDSFLKNDEPGLVWRTIGSHSFLIAELLGSEINSIALAGTNLVHGDAIRIRFGYSLDSVTTGTSDIDSTIGIATGKPVGGSSFVIYKMDDAHPFTHMSIEINATSNVDGYIDIARLIVGKSVNSDGIDVGAELSYSNDTNSYLDPKKTKPEWKVTISGLTEAIKFNIWHHLLFDLADQRGFLFVPCLESDYVQEQSIFGGISSTSKGSASNSDYWVLDLQIKSII